MEDQTVRIVYTRENLKPSDGREVVLEAPFPQRINNFRQCHCPRSELGYTKRARRLQFARRDPGRGRRLPADGLFHRPRQNQRAIGQGRNDRILRRVDPD